MGVRDRPSLSIQCPIRAITWQRGRRLEKLPSKRTEIGVRVEAGVPDRAHCDLSPSVVEVSCHLPVSGFWDVCVQLHGEPRCGRLSLSRGSRTRSQRNRGSRRSLYTVNLLAPGPRPLPGRVVGFAAEMVSSLLLRSGSRLLGEPAGTATGRIASFTLEFGGG